MTRFLSAIAQSLLVGESEKTAQSMVIISLGWATDHADEFRHDQIAIILPENTLLAECWSRASAVLENDLWLYGPRFRYPFIFRDRHLAEKKLKAI